MARQQNKNAKGVYMFEYKVFDCPGVTGPLTRVLCYYNGIFTGCWTITSEGDYYYTDDSY